MSNSIKAVLMAIMLAATACSDDQLQTIGTAPTTTQAEELGTTVEGTNTTTSAPNELAEYEASQLTLADLPEGWSQQPIADDGSDDSDLDSCTTAVADEVLGEQAADYPSASVSFSGGEVGPYLS